MEFRRQSVYDKTENNRLAGSGFGEWEGRSRPGPRRWPILLTPRGFKGVQRLFGGRRFVAANVAGMQDLSGGEHSGATTIRLS